MSESGDYTPKIWKDHDFASARAHYDSHVGRSYDDAVKKGKTKKDLLPESLTTDSDSPIVVVCDETGSMGEWPKTIFSKLPYLYNEASDEYCGKGVEISFGAFGDATCGETYPVQARPFASKDSVKKMLEELVIEGGGGGQQTESSELVALYYARNVSTPKAIHKPIFVFITDEYCYSDVSKGMAEEFARVKLQGRISTKEIFEELKAKYAVYLILKPYDNGKRDNDPESLRIRKSWLQYIDEEHIASLGDPTRVVDVIFGILAKETGKIDYFRKEIEDRQEKDKVAVAYKALKTIHFAPLDDGEDPKLLPAGHSTMFRKKGSGKTKKVDDLG